MNGYSNNGEVIVQVINYLDSIPEEDLPYLFDMLYIENYKIKYKKKHPPELEDFSIQTGYSLNRFRTPPSITLFFKTLLFFVLPN
ncbi:hypothetical protein DJ93_5702 [Bacillus clarus]|uniref:Uncharacterized protein n=1 Tax=Bacillus clarus TaxID=2338372 RepID=A0A090Y9K4_9BACI|nr:hypothetical protein [Bacillus clarus]KFM95129.1 hypothetical protein DJ93_5702 [Bacillus clarus]